MSKRFHCKPCNKEFSAQHQLQRHLERTSAHVQDAKFQAYYDAKFYAESESNTESGSGSDAESE